MLYTSVWTVSMTNILMARLAVIDPGHDRHHAELIGFLSSINSISILSHAQNIPPALLLFISPPSIQHPLFTSLWSFYKHRAKRLWRLNTQSSSSLLSVKQFHKHIRSQTHAHIRSWMYRHKYTQSSVILMQLLPLVSISSFIAGVGWSDSLEKSQIQATYNLQSVHTHTTIYFF